MTNPLSEQAKLILTGMRELGFVRKNEAIQARTWRAWFSDVETAAQAAQELIEAGLVELTNLRSLKLLKDLPET